MAPRNPKIKDQATATQLPKATSGAGVAKRQYKKVRFLENGLLDVERKTGKFLKLAKQNQRHSPLLRLPPEIRNHIYGYALCRKTFKIESELPTKGLESYNTTKSQNALALPAVCRQIYAETALLPYALNEFLFKYAENMVAWFKSTRPVYSACVTFVQIEVRISKYSQFGLFFTIYRDQYNDLFVEDWKRVEVFQELKSLRSICISMIALDHSGESLDAFLPKVIQGEREIKTKLQAQNLGVQIIIARVIRETGFEVGLRCPDLLKPITTQNL